MVETCGLGYLDSNASSCAPGWTYLDRVYPATEYFTCNKITVIQAYSGGIAEDWKIGIGTINTTYFTVKHVVNISGPITLGAHVFTAPADFTEFEVEPGDYLFFYSSNNTCRPTRTSSASPEGVGYAEGDKTGESGFTFAGGSVDTIEVQLSDGYIPSGWEVADIDGLEPSDVDSADGQSLEDIDTIDDL